MEEDGTSKKVGSSTVSVLMVVVFTGIYIYGSSTRKARSQKNNQVGNPTNRIQKQTKKTKNIP